ncbi:MAG: MFS transporter [Dehalococcoidia bacterium]
MALTTPEAGAAAARPMPWWVRKLARVRTFQSLANPHFRALWFGMLASYMAMNMNILARGYLTFELSHSATVLGVVTMVRGLPQLFLSPLGGVIADRVDKRLFLLFTQATMGVIAVINAVLIQFGMIQVWHLAVLSLAEGFVFAFNMPTRQAIVPELVEDHELTNAVAINNSGMNLTRIVGPSMAGALIGFGAHGLEIVFYLVALSYVGFIVSLWRLPKERRISRSAKGPFMAQLTGGIRYILGNRTLTALMGLAFIPILFGMPYQSLLPVFTDRVLHLGASALGLLSAASGAGALVGSLTVATMATFRRKDLLQVGFGALFGVALVGFGVTPLYGAALGWIFLVGLAGNAYMALNSTMIMATTDRSFHGRVMSVYMMTWSLMPLSTLPVGRVVDSIGVQHTLAVAGVIVAGFVVLLGVTRVRGAVGEGAPPVAA